MSSPQDNGAKYARPMAARTGRTHHFGISTEDIKTKVPEELKDYLRRFVRLRKSTESETIRDVLTDYMLGTLHHVPGPRHHGAVTLDSAISALATLNGMTRDEYIAWVLELHVFGALHVESMEQGG
jgi:hypothetical protein